MSIDAPAFGHASGLLILSLLIAHQRLDCSTTLALARRSLGSLVLVGSAPGRHECSGWYAHGLVRDRSRSVAYECVAYRCIYRCIYIYIYIYSPRMYYRSTSSYVPNGDAEIEIIFKFIKIEIIFKSCKTLNTSPNPQL